VIKKEAPACGRPRKAGVEDAVLEAIVMLVRQHGLEAVTIQMVADAAGVGRQTIYRRWPRREEMLLDALVKRTAESCSVPSTCRKARKSRRSVRASSTT
jgi:AcrR family transcriptional regulator